MKQRRRGRLTAVCLAVLAGLSCTGTALADIKPAGRITTFTCNGVEQNGRLTDFTLNSRANLSNLDISDNHLPLQVLYKLSVRQQEGEDWHLHPQGDTLCVLEDVQMDFRSEMTIGRTATEWQLQNQDGTAVQETAYTMQGGRLQIHEAGRYRLVLQNALVTDGRGGVVGNPVVSTRIIEVSALPEQVIKDAGRVTTFICNGAEQNGRLTDLTLSSRANLSVLDVSDNRLPLSVLYKMLTRRQDGADWRLQTQQGENSILSDSVLDFRSEITIGGTATEWQLQYEDGADVPASYYVMQDGRLQIHEAGEYRLLLKNDKVTDHRGGAAGAQVAFTKAISVDWAFGLGKRNGHILSFVCNGEEDRAGLTTLDVRDCASLKRLQCDSNRLASLDVSQNRELTDLSCRYNDLDFGTVATLSGTMQVLGAERYLFYPQHTASVSLTLQDTLNLSAYVPVYKDEPARWSMLTVQGDTLQVNKDYREAMSGLYFRRGGEYRLDVWHDSVTERPTPARDRVYKAVYTVSVSGDSVVWEPEPTEPTEPEQPDLPEVRLDTVSAPVFWPDRDTLRMGEKIVIYCATDSVRIYYTLDDRLPDTTALLYGDSLFLEQSAMVRAMAVRSGWANSEVTSHCYVIVPADLPDEPDEPIFPDTLAVGSGAGWIWMARAAKEKEVEFKGTGKGFRVDWGDGTTNDVKGSAGLYETVSATKDSEKELKHRYATEGIYTVTIEPLSAQGRLTALDISEERVLVLSFGDISMLEELDCSENMLTKLDLDGAGKLKELDCSENFLASLDLTSCTKLQEADFSENRITELNLPNHQSLKEVEGEENRLRLSTLYDLLLKRVAKAGYEFTPQGDSVTLAAGAAFDLSGEMRLGGKATTYALRYADGRLASQAEYTETNGIFRFTETGRSYKLSLQNPAVTEYEDGKAKKPVTFVWNVLVESVGNEDYVSDAASLRAYVQDRTIYLTADFDPGEVAVYTVAGQRIYQGYSRAIAVPQTGVYIVVAAGRYLKVPVR